MNPESVKLMSEMITALVAAATTIIGALGGLVAWLNARQTKRFGEMLRSEEHGAYIDQRAEKVFEVGFATAKDLENKWRRNMEIDLGDMKSDVKVLGGKVDSLSERVFERIGQVDQRAESAHSRLDRHIEDGDDK